MRKEIMNYEVILKITKAVAMSRDPEEVSLLIVESVKTALEAKGCALLLFNRKTNELELAASHGLSPEYLNKGPVFVDSRYCSMDSGRVELVDQVPILERAMEKVLGGLRQQQNGGDTALPDGLPA